MLEKLDYEKIRLIKVTSYLEDINPKHERKEFNAIN